MEKWAEIRRLVKVEKRSKRSVCPQFGIPWDTLVKIPEHTEPPGYRQTRPRAKRKIGPFLEVIDEILGGDKKVHRRRRHTARRIFERLKDEYEYPRVELIPYRNALHRHRHSLHRFALLTM